MIPHSCPHIGQDEILAVKAVIGSLYIKGGPRRDELEKDIALDQGYRNGIAVSTGTHALFLALKLLFPDGGGRVALQSYICRSAYDAVVAADCLPVVVDIDPNTLSITRQTIDKLRLDAVIVAHLFGIRAPIEEFQDLGLPVIEDCAQRIMPGRLAPDEPRGTMRVLSFEATKLMTCGEGGLLLLDEDELTRRGRNIRDGSYDTPEPAYWVPLTDIQAAMAYAQWKKLPSFIQARKKIAAQYLASFKEFADHIFPPMRAPDNIFFRFVLSIDNPHDFIRRGEEKGICFRRPVAPVPLHVLFSIPGNFAVTESLMDHLVSIPLYPRLSQEQIDRIKDIVQELLLDA